MKISRLVEKSLGGREHRNGDDRSTGCGCEIKFWPVVRNEASEKRDAKEEASNRKRLP